MDVVGVALQGAEGKKYLAQSFEIPYDRDIEYIRLRLRKVGNPTGTLQLKIYENGSVANPWKLGVSGRTELGTTTILAPAGSNSFPTPSSYTADQCTGGSASASSTFDTPYAASMAFDDSNATLWISTNALPSWIGYSFATAKTIRHYTITTSFRGGLYERGPRDFRLQYFDGIGWVDADRRSRVDWSTEAEKKIFDVQTYATSQFWRIYITDNDYTDGFNEITEIEMMEEVAIADSDTVDITDIESAFRWFQFEFSSLDLDIETRYWAALTTTAVQSDTDYIEWAACDETQQKKLVSWWSMDEASGTRSDSHGSNDLAAVNAPRRITGKLGGAVRIVSADSQYLTAPDDDTLSTGGSFTWMGWVRLSRLGGFEHLVYKWNFATQNEYIVRVHPSGYLEMVLSNDGTNIALWQNATTFGALAIDTWYCFAGWHDAENNLAGLSINGVEDTFAYSSGVHYNSTAPLVVGNPFWANIDLDELVYAKHARADFRTWFYNGGDGRSYSDVNNYPLGEMKSHNGNSWKPEYKDANFEIYTE